MADLFSGSVIPPQPTAADTSTSYPEWLQAYTYNLANAASNLSSTDYTPFPGPTVAAPSTATQNAWQMAEGNVGNYQNDLNAAVDYTERGAMEHPLPAFGGLSGDAYKQYMSPYTNEVVKQLQNASNYNLTQNQLPAINSQFVGAGQAASPQMRQADNNALYLSNQALDQATAGALSSGYNTALSTAQTQSGAWNDYLQKNAALALQQNQQKLQGGAQLGALGSLGQQLGGYDVGQVAASGQAQDTVNQGNLNSALNQFNAQQQWPYQNLAYASNIIRGQNIPSNTYSVGLSPASQNSYTASPLASFIGTTLGATAIQNGVNTKSNTGLTAAKGGQIAIDEKGRGYIANDNGRGALSRRVS